ncbi:MAG: Crp/Fnr family transcriptional regulator [Ignavibacteriaceae bacterium]|nr:Crp/Fnr family transcriptional regulator [Ignavibacteriaceae bacterium]
MLLDDFINVLKQNSANWDKFPTLFHDEDIPARTILLREGEIAQNIYYIKKGCLRLWFNNDGKDITFQFFFENQFIASIESFLEREPSVFSLESIEPTTVTKLAKPDFDMLFQSYPNLKDVLLKLCIQRMGNYAKLFLSRIKDNPRKRYEELLKSNPEIILRVPQHYIASYLGISPVSLSRIKKKI